MKKLLLFVISLIFTTALFAERPIVRDIQAIGGKGTKINIFWTLPKDPDAPITKLLVYRDLTPISSYEIIEKLTPIAEISPDFSGYTDTVSNYKDYFYAVVAVTDKPYDLILVTINSTIEGVHVELPEVKETPKKESYEKLYPDGKLRETPLPYIDLIDGINEESSISDATAISTKALSVATEKHTPYMTLYIFEEDLVSPDGGDDYLLFDILKTTLVQKKYHQAITQLKRLTGTNISKATGDRAYFYMGEANYLLGNYDEAVKCFVKVQLSFPNLTKKWIDSALDRI